MTSAGGARRVGLVDRLVTVRQRLPRLWIWAVLLAAFGASYASVLVTKPLYAPDSQYYAAMALWFGGRSKAEAHDLVAAYPGGADWETPAADVLFGWGLVQPRVVYPALSLPFVQIWGIDGLAVVPALAMLALVLLVPWFLIRRYGLAAGLAVGLLTVASSYLMFFGSAMLTESLTALWTALMVPVAWRWQRTHDRRMLWVLAGLTLLGAFTRQAGLIPAGAFVAAWVGSVLLRDRSRSWGWPALVVASTAIGAQLAQMVFFPTFSQLTQYLHATGTDSLAEAIRATPALAVHILRTDLHNYALADRPLLILVLLATIGALVLWRHSEAHLLVGAFAAVSLLNVTNGTPTSFRYAMPGLVFWLVVAAALLAKASDRAQREPTSDPISLPGQAGEPGTPTDASPSS